MDATGESHKTVPRPVEVAKYNMLLSKTKARLSVFVAGPYLEPSWQGDELTGKPPSVKLRAALRDFVRTGGNDVILGEHNGVAEITTETLPSVGNVAASELALVRASDAVIIIPDSPGSFCEVGAWSMMENVCRKTLVFPNAIYENQGGYLQNALLPLLRTEYARVHWLDYNDHDAAISIAEEFLSGIADRKILKELKGG